MYQVKKTTTKVIELEVKPCIKCGSTEVKTYDCGYSSFNCCGVECKNCDRKVPLSGDYSEEAMIAEWNKVNGSLTDQQKLEILRNQIEKLSREPLV